MTAFLVISCLPFLLSFAYKVGSRGTIGKDSFISGKPRPGGGELHFFVDNTNQKEIYNFMNVPKFIACQ
jgi:hypothetical protein